MIAIPRLAFGSLGMTNLSGTIAIPRLAFGSLGMTNLSGSLGMTDANV
jgi:hypothetical protein